MIFLNVPQPPVLTWIPSLCLNLPSVLAPIAPKKFMTCAVLPDPLDIPFAQHIFILSRDTSSHRISLSWLGHCLSQGGARGLRSLQPVLLGTHLQALLSWPQSQHLSNGGSPIHTFSFSSWPSFAGPSPYPSLTLQPPLSPPFSSLVCLVLPSAPSLLSFFPLSHLPPLNILQCIYFMDNSLIPIIFRLEIPSKHSFRKPHLSSLQSIQTGPTSPKSKVNALSHLFFAHMVCIC